MIFLIILLILFILYILFTSSIVVELFKSRRDSSNNIKCKKLPKVNIKNCPSLKVKCNDDSLVNEFTKLLEKIKKEPSLSLVSLSQSDITKTQNALNLYKKDCSYCMSNASGDYKCMQIAKQNLLRRIPMIEKSIYPWKNYDWDYGNHITNNYSPDATCAKTSPKIQQAYENAMAFSKLIDGMIADPIPNKKSIASTKTRDSDYPSIKICDKDYKCTATQKVKNSYKQAVPYKDPFLDKNIDGINASSYYFRVGDCPRTDIKNKKKCEQMGYTWTPNILSKAMDSNSEAGSCFQPRYAFIDNSAKPFFNGSNMKGMIPSIANDLMALSPDKVLGAMSGSSISNIYSIQPCYQNISKSKIKKTNYSGSSKGKRGSSKGGNYNNKILGCSKSGGSKGGNRKTKSSILGQGFSRFSI